MRETPDMEPISLSVADVTYHQLAKTIDHSLLKPEMTLNEVTAGCRLAAEYDVASVCCRPADVSMAVDHLAGTDVAVGTVVGFPHGSNATATKVFEARLAIAEGATELDMVINVGWLRSGEDERVREDVQAVVEAAGTSAIVKVILENAYLDEDEKVRGCKLTEAAGAHFVKTSTGYAPTGATIPDLRLMRASVGPDVRIKSAGGVRTLEALLAVIEAGVSRTGATATAKILDDYRARTAG
jgi:deoxyribose-phosphate aldolase